MAIRPTFIFSNKLVRNPLITDGFLTSVGVRSIITDSLVLIDASQLSFWYYNEIDFPHLNNSIGQGMQCRLSLKLMKEF
jgi:hypothetical protein